MQGKAGLYLEVAGFISVGVPGTGLLPATEVDPKLDVINTVLRTLSAVWDGPNREPTTIVINGANRDVP